MRKRLHFRGEKGSFPRQLCYDSQYTDRLVGSER